MTHSSKNVCHRLIPLGSEPNVMEYDPETHEMPVRPSLIDTMRQDMAPKVDTWDTAPMSPERASTPTIGFSYDYTTDEPPTIQRIGEAPTHASPHPDLPKLRAPWSNLARSSTALYIGPTDSDYGEKNGQALLAGNRRCYPANFASSCSRDRPSDPIADLSPWEGEGSW